MSVTALNNSSSPALTTPARPLAAELALSTRIVSNDPDNASAVQLARQLQQRDTDIADLCDTLLAAIRRVELANAEGNAILSAWLPDARAALARVDTRHALPVRQPEAGSKPLTELAALVQLFPNFVSNMGNAITSLVYDAFPRASGAAWKRVDATCVLTIKLTDGILLYPPTEGINWTDALDLQAEELANEPEELDRMDAAQDMDAYFAWLAQRAGVATDLLEQIVESLLVYARATGHDGDMDWRPSTSRQSNPPAEDAGNTRHHRASS